MTDIEMQKKLKEDIIDELWSNWDWVLETYLDEFSDFFYAMHRRKTQTELSILLQKRNARIGKEDD